MEHISLVSSATVEEVQRNLKAYLAEVEKGNEVLISQDNKPVARLVPADRAEGDWHRFSAEGLERAYGPKEPEYDASLIKEANPEYKP